MKLGNAPISWKINKQATISRSSSKATYRAIAHATGEILWLRHLLETLQVPCIKPTVMHCDNQATLHLAANRSSMKQNTLKSTVILSRNICSQVL